MKINTIISIIILVSSSYLYAEEKNKLHLEHERVTKLLEQAEQSYWKAKYKLIEHKQFAKDEIEELENRYGDLMKHRNSLKEEILSLKSENKEISGIIDNYKMRVSEIHSSQMKTIDSLTNFIRRNNPFTDQKDLIILNNLRTMIEKKINFISIADKILQFIDSKIDASEESTIYHADILNKDKILKKGKKIKLGYIFYGYITDDEKDAGIALRTSTINKKAFEWFEDISSYKDSITKTINKIDNKNDITFLPIDVMQSRAVGKSYKEGGSIFKKFLSWYHSGGIVMYGILLVLLYALFITIERIIFYRKNHLNADTLMTSMLSDIKKKKIDNVIKVCKEEKGSISRMLVDVLEEKNISRNEAYNKMQEVLLHEVPVIEKHLPTLKSLGALAPLLGLLGTVSGMISLFDVITTYGTGDPKLLAGGIAEALVTTEFGLIVAIPAILCHRMLLNIAEHIISDLERYSLTVLNLCWK